MEYITIHTEFIKLQQLLKLAGFVDQGSDVKFLLAEGLISVNGVVASERGKKIRPGDVVDFKGVGTVTVVAQQEA